MHWLLLELELDDLENQLLSLGKGIGPTTLSTFLRETRGVWSKADPDPSPLVKLAMRELGISEMKKLARRKHLDVVILETALLRLGKDFVRRGKTIEVQLDC